MTTKLPQIPSFDGNNTGDVLNAVKEALEVRVGRRGDALDTGVTFRDLEALGFVEQAESSGATGGLSTRASVRSTLSAGAIPTLYDPAADLTPPPGPSELKATAVFDTVYLSWNQPVFPNQSFWEVHKSFTNDLSTAVLAGTSTSQFFTDVVQEGVTLYYWVRTVSAAGIKSAWNSSFGTEVKTGIDPAKLIAALEGQILESALSKDLASRINDANDQTRISVRKINKEIADRVAAVAQEAAIRAQALLDEASARGTAITNEETLRAQGDSQLAQQITTLTSNINHPVTGFASIAALQTEQTARAQGDTAQATARETLAAQLRGNYTGNDIGALTTGLLYSEREARAYQDSALSSRSDALEATVNNPNTGLVATRATLINDYYTKAATDGAISASSSTLTTNFNNTLTGYTTNSYLTQNYYTKSGADSAIAAKVAELRSEIADPVTGYATKATLTSQYFTQTQTNNAITGQINTLKAEIADPVSGYAKTAAVQQNFFAKADGQALQGQYTVKIDLNGHVSGFGLASTLVGNTPTSAFIVRADRFAVVDPASTANGLGTVSPSADTVPFFIDGGATYIKNAVIKDASITDAKIGSVAAKKITAGYIGATIAMDSASVFGASLYAGGTTSKTYDPQGYVTSFTAQNPTFKVENGNVEIVSTNFRIKSLATANSYITPFKVENGVVYIDTLAVIKEGDISTAMIKNAEITSAQIINLQATKIVPGPNGLTIDANLITLDGGVTLDTYYDSSIGRSRLRIKDLGVTTAKINDLAVTNGKIDNLAVSTLKIAGNAITQPEVYTAADVYIPNNSSAAIQLTNSGVNESYNYVGAGNGDYSYVLVYVDPYTYEPYYGYDYVGAGNGDYVRVVTYSAPTFTGAITVIETPVVTVGVDSTAAVQIVYYATHDGSIYTYNDSGQHLFMLLDTGSGYRLVAQQQVGLRTDSSADTMASLPIAMTFTARNLTTARVKILTGSRRVDLPMGNFSNACWLRNSTISLLGAKR